MKFFLEIAWFIRQEKTNYLIGTISLILVCTLRMLPPYLVKELIDAILARTITRAFLLQRVGMILAVALILYALRYTWRLVVFGAAARLATLLRERLYRHFTLLTAEFYNRERTGDLMAHATNDINSIEVAGGDGLMLLFEFVVAGLLTVGCMGFLVNWKITLVALVPMLILAQVTRYYGKRLSRYFRESQQAFSRLNERVQENISGMRVVKSFGLADTERESFRLLSVDLVAKNTAVARIDALFEPTIQLIVGFSFFLSVSYGAWLVTRGEMSVGQITQFTMLLVQLVWPILAFGMLFNLVEKGRVSYARVNDLLHKEVTIAERHDAITTLPAGDLRYHVAAFSYPGSATPVLTGIDVSIARGETLGVTGRTGSGKSTFLRLLLREFDTLPGEIGINDRPIHDYSLDALRRSIGYVPQDHFLFSATVAENIAFGRPDARRDEIEAAARLAALDRDISRFPDGFDTLVGERGVMLSGGQKQRISIARALLLDPEILILDDCLSAVDARTEQRLLDGLRSSRHGRTTLIAAHRLSAIEHADRIIVIDDGKIVEQGNHGELMAMDGWYARMYRRQQLESQVEEACE